MDSNHRRRKPADLQSAPFGHSGICPFQNQEIKELFSNNMIKTDVLSLFFGFFLSLLSDSNQRPRDYKSRAPVSYTHLDVYKRQGQCYLSSTSAPASSNVFFNDSASSLAKPSFTVLGAPSTKSLASFKPRPQASLTALTT